LIDGQLFTYDFPDATQWFWRVNFTQTGLGQYNEIMGLKSAYEQTTQKLKAQNENVQDLVLIGMSRGATTILNFMGLHKPNNVKAVIVESPFDSTHSIAKNMLQRIYLDKLPGLQTVAHYIISLIFWQHGVAGISAIDSVEYIDKDMPILFVCSRQDALVTIESTISLYKKLRESGHHNVHIFITDQGRHGRILHGDDGHKYQQVVHAFYKKYRLAHDAALASQGASLLDQSKPDLID
jgi:alpha-beta hydrolase superfamily lysophospholipase